MWSDKKSISLSKLFILLFITALVLTALSAPWLVHRFIDFSRSDLQGSEIFFIATIYLGSLPAGYLLYNLYCLLRRIESDLVFIPGNVELLRRISWSCFAGAGLGLVSAAYYFPWMFVAISAAFMGLIVRVVKNVVAKAVQLQDEVDYTV